MVAQLVAVTTDTKKADGPEGLSVVGSGSGGGSVLTVWAMMKELILVYEITCL